jgi:hypothetical protein
MPLYARVDLIRDSQGEPRLLELEREFLRRAIREMTVGAADLKPVRWISMIDQKSLIREKL